MEARAVTRFIGSSPRKMRLVIDLIRGESVDKAMEILHFQPKHAAKSAEKTLRSAISNFMILSENAEGERKRYEPSDLFISEAFVNQGPTLKRISPAPMGRAYRIRKRSCHVTIIVATKN
ncbi:MAG TPA: 50S ribosomal protein L22 [Ignavibacteriaceae bacterium]|nr:50S ribosomal protein L22 [Ignavibacteriaceae bacterium]